MSAVPALASATGPLAQLERPPILVMGEVHTGAAWVADVLSAHPLVAGLSELRLFTSAGLEPPFRDSHWNPSSSGRMFDREMGLGQFISQERVVADLRALSDRWLARALSPEHRFLVERSPVGAAGLRAFAQLYPEATVIYVLRDGRGLVSSVLAEREHQSEKRDDPEETPAAWRTMWSSGSSWSAHTRSVLEASERIPVAFHELRYDAIAALPRASARGIFEVCAIPCDDALLDVIIERVGPPPPPAARGLTRLERALFNAGAGELLHELGYAAPPAPGARLLRQALRGFERVKRVI